LCYEMSRTITYVDSHDSLAISNYIYNFVNRRMIAQKSKNHFYSSGLNDPSGYKDKAIQYYICHR